MDDAWLHTYTAQNPANHERPKPRRRGESLLQQPQTDAKPPPSLARPAQQVEDVNPWRDGPPKATRARRAQSYGDFYDVVTSYLDGRAGKDARRGSLGGQQTDRVRRAPDLSFDDAFHELEDELLEQSHTKYQGYYDELLLTGSHLQHLLASTSTTLQSLSRLSESFKNVDSRTTTFRQQCETLLSDQERLGSIQSAIDENIQYYNYLEPITRRLNAPGAANLVKGNDFSEMLFNLDDCLAYMESHPNHKESMTYRSRYRLLLTRALTLIRQHFTKSLGDIAADITKRTQGAPLKETTHSALLYAKFRVPAPEMKALGVEIQKRAMPTLEDVDAGREPEYASLMRELYQSYSATRGRLMLPLVSRMMTETAASTSQSDVSMAAQESIRYMRGICIDEYELWGEWFETDGAVYELLESLMEPMLDKLRPRVIHETHIEKLCDLCAMIQGRYMDASSDDDIDSLASGSRPTSPANGKPGSLRKLDFASLVQPFLGDAQTRLTFLAMNALRDGIEYYKPTGEDLTVPKTSSTANGTKKGPVLSGKREALPMDPVTAFEEDIDDTMSASVRLTGDKHEKAHNASSQLWYPTLRKAVWLLRRIYRLVNSYVFDDLAHRIVHSTIVSLITASNLISRTKDKTPQDGQLFLITHLLQLKQQIVAFDIEFIPPEVEFDFSSVTNTFYELRDRGSLWNPASWIRLVGGAVATGALLPKVVENMLDAKSELDGTLRKAINDFVSHYSSHITAPLTELLPSSSLSTHTKPAHPPQQLTPDAAASATRTTRGLADKTLPSLRALLQAYIPDTRTRETLVAAVRDAVVLQYEDFYDAFLDAEEGAEGEGGVNGKSGSRRGRGRARGKGKGRESEVWEVEIFGEVMGRVFGNFGAVGDGDAGQEEA